MNIFISYMGEALSSELAQSVGKKRVSRGGGESSSLQSEPRGAEGWAIKNKAKFKQVKINWYALVQGSNPLSQRQNEGLQTIYYLAGKGSLSYGWLICEKGSWGLGSDVKNAGLEMEMWRLKTNRGVSSCACGCWSAARVQRTDCRSSGERRAVGDSAGAEVMGQHGAGRSSHGKHFSWGCFFAFVPFLHFLPKNIRTTGTFAPAQSGS